MTILHIQSWPGFNNIGGTEIFIKRLVENQAHDGHSCILLLPGENVITETTNMVVYESDFYEINGNLEFELGINEPNKFDCFQSFINEIKPDEVYFHCFWMKSFVYLNYLLSLNIKVKIIPHLANFSCFKGDLKYANKNLCDGKYGQDKCFKCSFSKPFLPDAIKSLLYYLSPNKIQYWNKRLFIDRIIEKKLTLQKFCEVLDIIKKDKNIEILCLTDWYYNILEKNDFQNLKHFSFDKLVQKKLTSPKPKNELKILFVGRINIQKGINTLIEAISKFDNSKIKLIIAGPFDGDYYKTEILLNNQIDYVGIKSQNEILDLMKISDLLVVPSLNIEMKPLVLIDAFKQELYPIGSDLGGIRELIQEYGGDLFKPGNTEELVSIISRYIK